MKLDKTKLMLFLSMALLLLFNYGNCFAMEYELSKNLSLMDGTQNGSHTIRVYALSEGTTSIEITETGSQNITGSISSVGEYGEWVLPAGAKINADKAVLVIKYDPSFSIETSLICNDVAATVESGNFIIIAASKDFTSCSIDLDDDGISEEYNIDTGYALICAVNGGKEITCSEPVVILDLNTGTADIKNIYLLIPNSRTYTPLYPKTTIGIEDMEL